MANVPLLPLGAKFYGVFHSVRAGDTDGNAMWVTFNFAADWQPQIDACKAVGGNFFPFMGHNKWIGDASMTQAQYLVKLRTVLDYIALKGMYTMPWCVANFAQYGSTTDEETEDLISSVVPVMAKYSNVIGINTMDEPWLGYTGEGGAFTGDEVVAKVSGQYAAAKAVAPSNLGICAAPNPCGDGAGALVFDYTGSTGVYTTTRGRCDSVAAYCDFFAHHPFYAAAAADSATLRAAFSGKELIIPSSVLSINGDGDMASRMTAVMDVAKDNVWCRGMGYYACNNGGGGTTWGMFNRDGPPLTPKSPATRSDTFTAELPAVVDPAHPVRMFPGNPRLNQRIRWGY